MKNNGKERPLQGQVALVTGGGRRIGRAIALRLANAGANVVVNYRTSRKEALETADEISALGAEALAIRADISKPREVQAMFRAVDRRFHRLDLLVNNAAIFYPVPWDRLTERDWDRMLGINLKGSFFCAQAAARRMMKQSAGQIINISSLGGIRAWPHYMHYCSSKAGVIMLTKGLAKALAPRILVNSIAPGIILFPESRPDPVMKKIIQRLPLGRGGEADDIASLVVYLAAQNHFITGQVFTVDGGEGIA